MTPTDAGTIALRLAALEEAKREHDKRIDTAEKVVDKHELELHGDRGIYAGMKELSAELKWTRRSMWGLAGALIIASVVFALGTVGGPAASAIVLSLQVFT